MTGNFPKVSILLPNLNTRPFLDERIKSILDQTFEDWELIIVDSYSDDGSWELFQDLAQKDSRVKLHQMPREGIYPAWNYGIKLAQGEYIYIATSDDTMMPNCLEKMVAALDQHPECGICHSCLQIIDEAGKPMSGIWEKFRPQLFYGKLIKKKHIRRAPLDGILHFGLHTMYSSLTQLLIRKKVFDEIGFFKNDWGSRGDFEWEMRASLVFDTIHIPEYLATWRKREGQGTVWGEHIKRGQAHLEMIKSVIRDLKEKNPELYQNVNKSNLSRIYERELVFYKIFETVGEKNRLAMTWKIFLENAFLFLECFFRIAGHQIRQGKAPYHQEVLVVRDMRKVVEKLGLKNCIEVLETK